MRLSSPFKIAKFGTFFCHLCSGCLQHKRYTLIVALFLLETVWRTSEDWSLGTSNHPKIPDFFAQIKPIEHLAGEIIRRSSASTLTSRASEACWGQLPRSTIVPICFLIWPAKASTLKTLLHHQWRLFPPEKPGCLMWKDSRQVVKQAGKPVSYFKFSELMQ